MPDFKTLKSELEHELNRILDYWINNTQDKKFGGFLGNIDSYNNVVNNAPKGAVLNARILWTFSAAYNFTNNGDYLKLADRSYNYLIEHFLDKEYGGIFWELDFLGHVLNDRKQIYAQGFGIYGLSEYYRASKNEKALEYAKELFSVIEKNAFDPEYGGYIEALGRKWNKLEDMRLSPKDANEPKSMNTHLHILEPYTNLYRVWPDPLLKAKIAGLIDIFLNFIIDVSRNHFHLFFGMDWAVRSTIDSYGHDIEGSWLLYEAAEVIGDDERLKKLSTASLQLVDATINEGITPEGAVYNEKNYKTGHLDEDKHWWPQAEAMVGLINTYEISGDKKYLELMIKTWQFIKEFILDTKNGEWFWRVDKTGQVIYSEDKAGFWKCPYHNSRTMIEVLTRMNKLKLKLELSN
ncbi:MAG: AGE family epimerase/isomerase [Bacteroidales bacterium]|nr:AGE family epimerase/isomerase [Bacteroidales bacterium]